MTTSPSLPIGVTFSTHVEDLPRRRKPFRARIRWVDPVSGKRQSASLSTETEAEAHAWIAKVTNSAKAGLSPQSAKWTLAEYGEAVMPLAVRGLEAKTLDPYLAGWRRRVVPTLGHLSLHMTTNGAVDRAVHAWIADDCSRSTVKNSLAILVRVMEQAVRDGVIDRNPARVTGWQHEFRKAEDELDDPRSLALPDWQTLQALASALVERSNGQYQGWGDIVRFAACTAARIGEVSGVRAMDVDPESWMWTVRRQTTPSPGGLIDKGTKGKRARTVPIIEPIRPMVQARLDKALSPDSRLFTGPRGGRVVTAVLRDATSWDDVVKALGYEHLRRHDLRHTGLTWMADAGVPVHVLRKIAGHGSLSTTQRYLHPDRASYEAAGDALTSHLWPERAASGPQLHVVDGPSGMTA